MGAILKQTNVGLPRVLASHLKAVGDQRRACRVTFLAVVDALVHELPVHGKARRHFRSD